MISCLRIEIIFFFLNIENILQKGSKFYIIIKNEVKSNENENKYFDIVVVE